MTAQAPLEFEVVSGEGTALLRARIDTLVVAGWTGRDPEAMEKHIRELEELGVTRPATTPIFYRVSAARLTQSERMEVPGRDSSGEVEFMLLRHEDTLYVGLGSDHTDRKVETYNVTVSKQMCDKPVARQLWRYADVRPHWDRLILRAWIEEDGGMVSYQEGPVTAMLDPETLLDQYQAEHGPLPDGAAMLCGTLAARGGVRFSPAFTFELNDPELGRTIAHSYRVEELPILG